MTNVIRLADFRHRHMAQRGADRADQVAEILADAIRMGLAHARAVRAAGGPTALRDLTRLTAATTRLLTLAASLDARRR